MKTLKSFRQTTAIRGVVCERGKECVQCSSLIKKKVIQACSMEIPSSLFMRVEVFGFRIQCLPLRNFPIELEVLLRWKNSTSIKRGKSLESFSRCRKKRMESIKVDVISFAITRFIVYSLLQFSNSKLLPAFMLATRKIGELCEF